MEMLYTREELARRAKKARLDSGDSQGQAAKKFNVHRQTIVSAENNFKVSLDDLRVQMIEGYGGVKVGRAWIIMEPVETQNAQPLEG